ncbi:helix-turn-helix domain-containing protein [Azospirillum humicireducens]|uniref:helix-turn-helix domain-containing protein n=1 Tax=Azospirillum humicireducens TaxID=1226968 RepID=UPI001F1B34C0|nr:helix-turn-helix transcriptional regulator [Azospirillum humicireducens]
MSAADVFVGSHGLMPVHWFVLTDEYRSGGSWSRRYNGVMIRLMSLSLKQRVGLRVKEARVARSLTQEALADLVGRTVEAVSNIERGRTFPTIETLEQLGRHLDVPIQYFFEDVERKVSDRRFVLEGNLKILGRQLSNEDLEIAVRHLEIVLEIRKNCS